MTQKYFDLQIRNRRLELPDVVALAHSIKYEGGFGVTAKAMIQLMKVRDCSRGCGVTWRKLLGVIHISSLWRWVRTASHGINVNCTQNAKVTRYSGKLGEDIRILKLVVKKQGVRLWSEFMWLKTRIKISPL